MYVIPADSKRESILGHAAMEKITVQTKRKKEFVDVTRQVQDAVAKSGVSSGVCHAFVPHTTCGLTINENADPAVRVDMQAKLEEIVAEDDAYTHAEGNSDAHIKSSLLGHAVTVFVENGSLQFGAWQGIYLCEFDGPRTRQLWVKIVPG